MTEEPGVETQETPQQLESLKSEIREYYKGAEVGTPKFMAFWDVSEERFQYQARESWEDNLTVKITKGEGSKSYFFSMQNVLDLETSKLVAIRQTILERRTQLPEYNTESKKVNDFYDKLLDAREAGKDPDYSGQSDAVDDLNEIRNELFPDFVPPPR